MIAAAIAEHDKILHVIMACMAVVGITGIITESINQFKRR